MAFCFEKPNDFIYQAGQHINLTLIDSPENDDEGATRIFSLASAPCEDYLMVATRMRDTAFKRILKNMVPGSEIEIYGPSGNFALQKNASRPLVFLAGGIGITPFYGIVKQAICDHVSNNIFLFYSNKKPEDAAFLGELVSLEKKHPNFKLIGTMTEMEKSGLLWNGETGYINKEMLEKYVKILKSSVYYIAGPPPMTMAMRAMLANSGIKEDDIRRESFFGY